MTDQPIRVCQLPPEAVPDRMGQVAALDAAPGAIQLTVEAPPGGETLLDVLLEGLSSERGSRAPTSRR